MMPSTTPLLEVQSLAITLQTQRGAVRAVHDLGFTLARGDTLGLIGESGCGKSLTALALMGLLPEGARVQGQVRFDGQDLLAASEAALCRLRGNRVAMVFQEPMSALNPVHPIGRQVAEPLRLHQGLSAHQARAAAVELLERVGITQAAARLDAYPHQFSGGQRQRITIAMALACGPDLLIADEPTTALDVTVQRQILELIQSLAAERGMALILISHDLGVIAQNTQRTLVMYGGTVVEAGPTRAVFANRAHPYTQGLFAARPRLGAARVAGERLPTIAGSVPDLADLPAGCPFAGRCPRTMDACHAALPPAVALDADLGGGHMARCIRLGDAP